jgi:hypothetical protein
MVFLRIAVKIPSPLTKHTRPLLITCFVVMIFLKVILVLYEQFGESASRYCHGTGCILSGVKVTFWVKIDDSFTTDGKIIICLACNKSIDCSIKLQLEQHVPSALHTNNKQLGSTKKQVVST